MKTPLPAAGATGATGAHPSAAAGSRSGELLRLIAERTAWATGPEFFRALVRCIAEALDVPCAFVTEFLAQNSIARPLAFWNADAFADVGDYALAGTPCETVLAGDVAAIAEDIVARFPAERAELESLGAESYLAIPITDAAGAVLGHLAVIDRRRRAWSDAEIGTLKLVSARTAGEILRARHEDELEAANARLQEEIAVRSATEVALRQSELAYRGFYEDAPVAYWAVGTDRIIRRVNKRVTELLGYPAADIVGEPLSRFTAPTAQGEGVALRIFQRFLRGEATSNEEVEFRHRDGRSVWAAVSVVPVRNECGELVETRSVVVDITERKLAEHALQHRLALENLIATASSRFMRAPSDEVDGEINACLAELAGFYAIERLCIYLFTGDDRRAEHTHSWSAAELTRSPSQQQSCTDSPALFADVLAGRMICSPTLAQLPPGYELLREKLALGGIQSIAILPLAFGSRVMGMLLLEARRQQEWADEDLRLLRLLGEIIASALARRAAERVLRDARMAAEAASRAKSEFLANMSHELRTPLNGILGYAQLLARDSALTASQLEAVNSVRHCGEHLLDLVNEILDLTRIEAGRIELHTEDVEVASVIDEAADVARLRAAQAGLGFIYERGCALPRAVRVDARRLKQVLLNLLGNAVKFTPAGQVRFRVQGEEAGAGRWRLRFDVKDTGIGIPPEELPHIFEPFHRAPGVRAMEGTGLGLAITHDLVRIMGGRLQVESTPGQGSRFTVELELAQADLAQTAAAPRALVAGYHGRRRSLLVADDKSGNRALLRNLLEPVGFTVHEARDGEETLAVARRVRPDLILLDLVMPAPDGFEVARRLRADEALGMTPIVAVSASVLDDTRTRCLQAGCDDFMPKPVDLDSLLARLERFLGLRWISAERPRALPQPEAGEADPPPLLLARLLELSRRGDIADVNRCLEELEDLGGHPRLVAELRLHARAFDMKAIRDRLQRIAPERS